MIGKFHVTYFRDLENVRNLVNDVGLKRKM